MENVQTGSGWSGLLVLRGNFDISPVLQPMLTSDAQFAVVYGDTKEGQIDFRVIPENTPTANVIAHVTQKLPVAPFALLIAGDLPLTMNVPARSTAVTMWNQGQAYPGFQSVIESLIQLNREPIPESANYAQLVRDRVFKNQIGKFVTTLGYFSRHPRVVLASRNMQLYTWIVYYNGVYMFLWSTDPSYIDRIREQLDQVKQNELFALEIDMGANAILVVHPLFWVTKFNRALGKMRNGSSRLTITSYFRNYVARMALPHAVNTELPVVHRNPLEGNNED